VSTALLFNAFSVTGGGDPGHSSQEAAARTFCVFLTIAASRQRTRRIKRETDFGKLIRGKHAARLAKSSNIVLLDPEIAEFVP